MRQTLPAERPSLTKRFSLIYFEDDETEGKQVKRELTLYIQPGMYPDGRLGEVFIKGAKQGELLSGVFDTFAMTLSLALQHGIPLKTITSKLLHSRFGPGGVTGDKEFPMCTSVFDLIAQYLESRFPNGLYYQIEPNADLPEGGQSSTPGNGSRQG